MKRIVYFCANCVYEFIGTKGCVHKCPKCGDSQYLVVLRETTQADRFNQLK